MSVCLCGPGANMKWVHWKICIFHLDSTIIIRIKECILNEKFFSFFFNKLEDVSEELLLDGMQFLILEVSADLLMIPISHFQLGLVIFSKKSMLFFTLNPFSQILLCASIRKQADGNSLF